MSYEEFREQCAKTIELCDDAMMAHDDYVLDPSECASIVRALPLPEVTQEPIYQLRCLITGEWLEVEKYLFMASAEPPEAEGRVLFISPPDAEALRKENEQLRLAMIKCEQEADFALKQVSQTKIYAAVRKIKELANAALKGGAA